MDYETTCPGGHRLRVTEAHFGQEIKCPTCSAPFVVPDLSNESASPDLPRVDTSASSRRAGMSAGGFDLNCFAMVGGRPMMALGLILVLVSRGCDSIGARSVSRAQGRAQKARDQFDDKWSQTQLDIDGEIKKLQEKDPPAPEDSKLITDHQKELSDLQKRQRKARELKETGEWRDLDNAAKYASLNNRINRYWREIFFVFSSVVFALGLLSVSWVAQGTERMVCLIMLAILTFSLYIGGIAWATFPDLSEIVPPEVLRQL